MSIQLLKNAEPQHIVPESTTVDSDYARELLQGAIEKGYDINHLLLRSGISPQILQRESTRVSFRQLADLSHNIVDLLNDEFYGLVDKPQRRGTFKMLCYSCISADTIGEAMERFAEFMNLLENTWYHQLDASNNHLLYQLVPRKGVRLRHRIAIEYLYSTLYRTLCWMANRQLPLARVALTVKTPRYPERYRFMFYDAPVFFGQNFSGLYFHPEVYDSENVRNKNELEIFLKQTPLTLLTQTVPANNLSSRVRIYVERQLTRNGKLPNIEHVANHLSLHPQTFRRKLQAEQTSFSEIKSDTRRDLAIGYILDGRHSVAEISDSLDFSEPSAFIRAFKQWTGVTPKTYRKAMDIES